jgi:BirA family biotin operon repressor/biotin-[acetyl-CoA-carboxylase] ligase
MDHGSMNARDEQRKPLPFVRTLVEYEVIDSTSDRAALLVAQGIDALPLMVWSRRQTQGRGRSSHSWWSDSGSLTFTLAIDPAAHGLAREHEPTLALAMCVAVIEALDRLDLADPSIGIRWPNDLEADGRKLGGILPEPVETELGRRVLMGVGLNIATSLDHAPEEVRRMATSLAALHGDRLTVLPLPRLLAAITSCVESVLIRLVRGDSALAAEWRRLDLLRDRRVCVDLGTRVVAGLAQGIDPQGALCVHDGREVLRLFGGRVLR